MTIQTFTIWLNKIHSLKYKRFTTFGCKDKETGVLGFVAKTQFFYNLFIFATSWYCKPFIFKLWKFDWFKFKAQNIKIFMTSGLELRLEFVASVQTSDLLLVWTHVYQFNWEGGGTKIPSTPLLGILLLLLKKEFLAQKMIIHYTVKKRMKGEHEAEVRHLRLLHLFPPNTSNGRAKEI